MARDFDAGFNNFDPITFTWDLAVHKGSRGFEIILCAPCSREDLVLMDTGLLYVTTNQSDDRGIKESQRVESKLDRVTAIRKS